MRIEVEEEALELLLETTVATIEVEETGVDFVLQGSVLKIQTDEETLSVKVV